MKEFPDKRAIHRVDFHVEWVKSSAESGCEGAVRTAAYRLVYRLVSPTNGRVRFAAVDVTEGMPDSDNDSAFDLLHETCASTGR